MTGNQRLSAADCAKAIADGVSVSVPLLGLARRFVVDSAVDLGWIKTAELLEQFPREMQIQVPKQININPQSDPYPDMAQAAKYIASAVAVIESVHSLIGQGILHAGEAVQRWRPQLGYTTVLGGSGQSGGLDFGDHYSFTHPQDVRLAPSFNLERSPDVWDSGLFSFETTLGIAHPDVREALSDASQCLRYELARPAVAMLGKAVEGAWTELGLALSHLVHGLGFEHDQVVEKLTGRTATFRNTVDWTLNFCRSRPACATILKGARVSMEKLQEVGAWSHVVRNARNAIHLNAETAVPVTVESTLILFLGARTFLPDVYKVVQGARRYVAENNG